MITHGFEGWKQMFFTRSVFVSNFTFSLFKLISNFKSLFYLIHNSIVSQIYTFSDSHIFVFNQVKYQMVNFCVFVCLNQVKYDMAKWCYLLTACCRSFDNQKLIGPMILQKTSYSCFVMISSDSSFMLLPLTPSMNFGSIADLIK